MSDVRPIFLFYDVTASKNIDIDCEPIHFQHPDFMMELPAQRAISSLKRDFPSLEHAKSSVQSFIDAWLISHSLEQSLDEFTFE